MKVKHSIIASLSITMLAFMLSCSEQPANDTKGNNEQGDNNQQGNNNGGENPTPPIEINYGYCDYGPVTQYGGGCFKMENSDDCDLQWGQVVSYCPSSPSSSSSNISVQSSSSSVVAGSSSSARSSSSSVVASSSSSARSSSSSVVASSSSSARSSSSSMVASSSSSVQSGSSASKCNGKDYNPTNQRCENNVIETKCGTVWYDATNTNLRCQSINILQGRYSLEAKCGTSWYDATNTNLRCQSDVVQTKCGTSWYDATNTNFRCQSNILETKCGTSWYDATNTNLRCELNVIYTKCGTRWYDATSTNFRCQSNILETKCGTSWYDDTNTNLRCKSNAVEAKCGGPGEWNFFENCLFDARDDRFYKKVRIGTQTWMAQDLAYDASGSMYGSYGNARLYYWATAMGLPSKCNSTLSTSDPECAISIPHKGTCPVGYHIPSDAEWDVLVNHAGGSAIAGDALKARSEAWQSNYGTDTYGFAAMPSGYFSTITEVKQDVGYSGYWWSATEDDARWAYHRLMVGNYKNVVRSSELKSRSLYSVRCLQD